MLSSRRKDLFIPAATVFVDAVAIELAFLLSYWLRFHSPLTEFIPVTKGFPPLIAYVRGSLFVIPVWLWLFSRRGMYRTRRNLYFSDEFFALVRLVVIGMLVVMAAAFFYRTFSYSRAVFGLLGLSAILTLSLGRVAMMSFERLWYRRGFDLECILIVGSSPQASRLSEAFARKPQLGYRVVGYCTVDGRARTSMQHSVKLGSINDVPRLIRERQVHLVLIALGESNHDVVERLIRECEGLNVELMMVPDLVELLTSQVSLKDLEGVPLIRVKGLALSPWNTFIKRTFDVVTAIVLLLLLSPIFLFLILLVKMTSKGPVFFLQERVGLNGETFKVIKFRSMRVDAEKSTGPVWAKRSDPRTTAIGRILRRFSLDELPQLINVIRGHMSLVGPRPERPHFVEQFRKKVPKYLERQRVKTGMTGWAQVNGMRGNAPIEERTRYDVYYVENWSLVFDLKIILKTIRAVLFGKDAY